MSCTLKVYPNSRLILKLMSCYQQEKESENVFLTLYEQLPLLIITVINPDNTFEVSVDGSVVNSGSLLDDFRYCIVTLNILDLLVCAIRNICFQFYISSTCKEIFALSGACNSFIIQSKIWVLIICFWLSKCFRANIFILSSQWTVHLYD